jgi:hypothetical protein
MLFRLLDGDVAIRTEENLRFIRSLDFERRCSRSRGIRQVERDYYRASAEGVARQSPVMSTTGEV